MPDLTLIACPTCGLPAEILETTADQATARCVVMHDFTIDIKTLELPREASRPPQVVQFRPPQARSRPEWARRAAWFAFGALAALLLLRAPVAAPLLLPLSLPFIGVEAARKSWRPLSPKAPAVQLPWTKAGEDEGRKVA